MAGMKKKKKSTLTLSTDLERRGITDMAAVLWQETEAAAPVGSSGQMAVVNMEAQSEDLCRLSPCLDLFSSSPLSLILLL